jgi:hypothetical protein
MTSINTNLNDVINTVNTQYFLSGIPQLPYAHQVMMLFKNGFFFFTQWHNDQQKISRQNTEVKGYGSILKQSLAVDNILACLQYCNNKKISPNFVQ